MDFCFGCFHFTKVKKIFISFPMLLGLVMFAKLVQLTKLSKTDATKYVKHAFLQCWLRKLGRTNNEFLKKEEI